LGASTRITQEDEPIVSEILLSMKYCDLSLPSPEENLACDEVLLDLCESGEGEEVLRMWEPSCYFVVLGYANRAATEVNLPFCKANTIPVLRRCTGGGTVVQGPGVLNYTLILRSDETGPLRSITSTNDYVMARNQAALAGLLRARIERHGHTDLALGGLKFCGNAQRRHRRTVIFHGSFLLHLDIELMEKILPMPSRQPDYRLDRSHSDFLMNLKTEPGQIKSALARAWNATERLPVLPLPQIQQLATKKYALPDWNYKF
jgi:lipoate-protein ligase A